MSTAAIYNLHKESRTILKKFRKQPASVSIELYPKHFRFKDQNMIFPYESPMKAFLEAVRAQQIPYDLIPALSAAKVPYYEGCLIVELIDHRTRAPPSNEASTSNLSSPSVRATAPPARIVLHPSPGSLWEHICEMNEEMGGKWDDFDALQLEARVLAAVAPPLFLGTSFYATRVANVAVALTSPSPIVPASYSLSVAASAPRPPKRNLRATEEVEDVSWKDRLMHTGELPKDPRGFQPTFARFTTTQFLAERKAERASRTSATAPYSGTGLYDPPATFTNAFGGPLSATLFPPNNTNYQTPYNGPLRPPSQVQQQHASVNGSGANSVAGTPGPSDDKKPPKKKKGAKKDEVEGNPAPPVVVKVTGKGHPKVSMKNKPTHPPPPPSQPPTDAGNESDTSIISASTNKKKGGKKGGKTNPTHPSAPAPPPPHPIQPKLDDQSSSGPAKKKQRLHQPLSIPIPPPPPASAFQQQQPQQHPPYQQQPQHQQPGMQQQQPNLNNLTQAQMTELAERRRLHHLQQQMLQLAAQTPELMMNGFGVGGGQQWGGQ